MKSKLHLDAEIYQELIDFYGGVFSLTPLSAKIYAYLAFDFEKNGLAFDELVETFCASKSSISASINFLLNANLIKTVNKIDERKRYFVFNDDFVKFRFEEIVNRLKREIKILDQLSVFRKTLVDNTEYDKRYILYKSLLEKNIANIQETLDKL